MEIITRKLGFPVDICKYISNLYLQDSLSKNNSYLYHTSIERKKYLQIINNTNIIYPLNLDVQSLLRKTLYDEDFKTMEPRYYLHADPFQIYLCGSGFELSKSISLKYRIKKMTNILKKNHYPGFIYRKLTIKAIGEGYYNKDLRNIYWKLN